MKALHRTFAMLLLALLSVVSATAQEPKGADIEFQTTVVDFGSIEQDGGKQLMRLSFTNTGDVPLVVTEVRTSCSCMSVKIEPSERGVLTITLDPAKALKGQYYRVMQVFSTAKSGTKRITVKAVIE